VLGLNCLISCVLLTCRYDLEQWLDYHNLAEERRLSQVMQAEAENRTKAYKEWLNEMTEDVAPSPRADLPTPLLEIDLATDDVCACGSMVFDTVDERSGEATSLVLGASCSFDGELSLIDTNPGNPEGLFTPGVMRRGYYPVKTVVVHKAHLGSYCPLMVARHAFLR